MISVSLIVMFLLTSFVFCSLTGCKSSDKGDSSFPFFGTQPTQVPPPPTGTISASPSVTSQPVIVQEGPGPLPSAATGNMPLTQTLPSGTPVTVTQGSPGLTTVPATTGSVTTSNGYAPPVLSNPNPAGTAGTPPPTSIPASTAAPISTTPVPVAPTSATPAATTGYVPQNTMTTTTYEAPPNAEVNAGAKIGPIPSVYVSTSTDSSASTTSGQPYNNTQYGNTQYSGGSSGGAYAPAGQGVPLLTPPNSRQATPQNYIPPNNTLQNNTLNNRTSIDADGYSTAPDGTKLRSIGGRTFTLTAAQYPIGNVPDVSVGATSSSSASSQPIAGPGYHGTYDSSAVSPISSPYSSNPPYSLGTTPSETISSQPQVTITPDVSNTTAEISTRQSGNLRISSYESLLSRMLNGVQGLGNGLVTTVVPTSLKIEPEESGEPTVASLDLSQFANIGAVSASDTLSPAGRQGVSENGRSLWGVMARQDQNYLLYRTQTQPGQTNANDQLQYIALNEPPVTGIQNRSPVVINSVINSAANANFVTTEPCCSPEIILGQSPCCVPCRPSVIYFRR